MLHCVLYPRLEYDLPILSFDMVGSEGSGRVSLAIADPCPASMDRWLPQVYVQAATYALFPFTNNHFVGAGHVWTSHCALLELRTRAKCQCMSFMTLFLDGI